MIPTPAKRRQLFDEQLQQLDANQQGKKQTDYDNDDDEQQTSDHESNQDNHRASDCDNRATMGASGRLTLAQQRLLLCKEQQLQIERREQDDDDDDDDELLRDHEEADDSIERAYIHQHLVSDNQLRLLAGQQVEAHDQEELGLEDQEEYLGLDTIEEEDELMIDSDHQTAWSMQSCDNRSGPSHRTTSPVVELDRPPPTSTSRPPAEPLQLDSSALRTTAASTTTSTTGESDEQQETMTTLNSLNTNMDTQADQQACDTNKENSRPQSAKSSEQDNNKRHSMSQRHHQHHQQTLLPSTNRLISEHQARQEQTALFRALAERQKLLDELGPGERQQVDLMSTCTLPARSQSGRSLARRRRHSSNTVGCIRSSASKSTNGRRMGASQAPRQLEQAHEPTRASGVPLSSVDLSSMSDRMLDDLLGHIASASSSSLSSNGGESLESSDFSRTSSSGEDEDDDHHHHHHHNHHLVNGARHSGQLAAVRSHEARQTTAAMSSHTPSVIGVHEDLDVLLGSRGQANAGRLQNKCREAHRKSRRRNSNERDDDDDDVQDELRVCVNQSGTGGQSSSNSLSPIGQHHHQHHNNNNYSTCADMRHTNNHLQRANIQQGPIKPTIYTPNAPSPIESSSSSSEPSSASTLNSSYSLANSCASSSSCYSSSLATTNGQHSLRRRDQQVGSTTGAQRADQSVEAVLGRMLEALNELGQAGQANNNSASGGPSGPSASPVSPSDEPQEQLNDLLERGFLHLEQLLNCSLAPTVGAPPTTTTTLPISGHPQQVNSNDNNNRSQHHKLISSTLMSKDSDYGSDTQSGDCYASSQMLAGSSCTGGHTEAYGSASLPVDKQRPSQATKQPTVATGANALSPLAIDLSFKLAESLRRLAQQQQAARDTLMCANGANNSNCNSIQSTGEADGHQHRDDQLDSVVVMTGADDESSREATPADEPASTQIRPTTTTTTTTTNIKMKTPMKSIVMINSSAVSNQTSATFNINKLQAEPQEVGVNQEARNLTPNEPDDQIALDKKTSTSTSTATDQSVGSSAPSIKQPPSRQHKTCVSLNVSSTATPTPTPTTTTTTTSTSNGPEQTTANLNADQVTIQQVHFERRRQAARSSLRRRASFTGSVGSVRELGAPRPGSPVPRAALEVPANVQGRPGEVTVAPVSTATARQQTSDHQLMMKANSMASNKQQRQLQRVLVLGQKYNYSPAKLAASKLSSKLQLKDYQQQPEDEQPTTESGVAAKRTLTNSNNGQEINAKTTITGRVLLDVGYFAKSGSLTVHLMECQQLAAVSKRRTTSNPYVKLYLLPDRSKNGKRKSSLKRNELSPKFDERFTFGPIQLHEFDSRCLWLSVWHKDRLGRNDFLGELLLPLVQVRQQLFSSDLCQSTSARWYSLSDRLQLATINNPQVTVAAAAAADAKQKADGKTEMAPKAHQQQRATAEQVANRLSEFERKAARLAQTAAVAPPSAQETKQEATTMNNRSQYQPTSTASNNSSPADMMNVTLAPEVATANTTSAVTGQLFVALKFVPESGDLLARRTAQMEGELRVLIKEAHNLAGFGSQSMMNTLTRHPDDSKTTPQSTANNNNNNTNNLPSPLAKCYLLDSNGQRLAKQKTGHLKRTANPRWDHECSFHSLKLAALQAQAIEIHLFNRDSILSGRLAPGDPSNCLGSIRLCKSGQPSPNNSDSQSVDSMGSTTNRSSSAQDSQELCSEREAKLWTQMLARPNIWVYGELPLRQLRALVARPHHQTAPPSETV